MAVRPIRNKNHITYLRIVMMAHPPVPIDDSSSGGWSAECLRRSLLRRHLKNQSIGSDLTPLDSSVGLGQTRHAPWTAGVSGTKTRPMSPSTVTAYVLSGFFAGPRSTAPVHTLNCAPCKGHVTVEPSSVPSLNG